MVCKLDQNIIYHQSSFVFAEQSSKNLTDTHEEFKTMGGHIQNSKRILTKYGQRELTDKLLIFIALVFFFATVIYILKRRLWS
jgi:protein transport protein SEC20